MLTIQPLASPLNDAARVGAAVAAIGAWLDTHAISHRFVVPGEGAGDVLLILTGGTEHLALEALAGTRAPAFLLAHPEQNSLPAALEIVSRLQQTGRRGHLALVGPHGDAASFLTGLAGHLATRRQMMASRLGRIGAPSDWLVASTPDPEVVREVWGPSVIDVSLGELRDAMAASDPTAVADEVRRLTQSARACVEPSGPDLSDAARVSLALRTLAARHHLDACTIRCFDLVVHERTTGCLGVSRLLDAGIVAGCEGDVPAALTMLWGQVVTGQPTFMANPQDVDRRTGRLWLAHCTIATRLVTDHVLRSHFESGLGVGIQGTVPPGDATVVRIGGANLRDVFVADGRVGVTEPVEQRCRTQLVVELAHGLDTLLTAPLGNHHVVLRGHHEAALREYHGLFVAH